MVKELLSSCLIRGGIVFVVFMIVGSLLYLQHVEREIARDLARSAEQARRYEEILRRAPQDTAAEQGGRAPNSDGDVLIASEEERPSLNPYEGITETGQAPPEDYYGNPIFWIPSMQYETRGEPGDEVSVPILPNYEGRIAIRDAKRQALYEAQGGKLTQAQRGQITVEVLTEGLAPLDAAKYFSKGGGPIGRKACLQFAQQALEANPDDFHTLLVWTSVQFCDTRNPDAAWARMEAGYRRLLEMNPNSAFILYRLGGTLGYVDYPEKVALLEKAIRLAPEKDLGKGAGSTNIRDGALQKLARNYFYHSEKEKSLETLNRLLTVTQSPNLRRLTQERIQIIQEENQWPIGLH